MCEFSKHMQIVRDEQCILRVPARGALGVRITCEEVILIGRGSLPLYNAVDVSAEKVEESQKTFTSSS